MFFLYQNTFLIYQNMFFHNKNLFLLNQHMFFLSQNTFLIYQNIFFHNQNMFLLNHSNKKMSVLNKTFFFSQHENVLSFPDMYSYIVHCTRTLYTVHCTLYIVHCTLYCCPVCRISQSEHVFSTRIGFSPQENVNSLIKHVLLQNMGLFNHNISFSTRTCSTTKNRFFQQKMCFFLQQTMFFLN